MPENNTTPDPSENRPTPGPNNNSDKDKTLLALWKGFRRSVKFTRGNLDLDPREDLNRAQRLLVRNLRVLFLVFRWEVYKRVELHAQALTMKTLLALVPAVVVVVAMTSKLGSGMDTVNQRSIEWLIASLAGTEEISSAIQGYLSPENFNAARLGPVTIIILSLTVMSLLSHVEVSFNTLFQVQAPRSMGVRLVTYWALLTLGPLLLGLSLAFTLGEGSAQLTTFLDGSGILRRFIFAVLPWFLTWAGFAILYIGIPNTRVRIIPAVLAAVVAGTLWNLAKFGFAVYARNNVTVRDIYGSLATFPMFILWVYISWILLLAGCQLCYAFHHASTYRAGEAGKLPSFASQCRAMLRIFWQVADDFHAGRPATNSDDLADLTGLPRSLVQWSEEHLETGGFVRFTEDHAMVPARDLDSIRFADLVQYVQHDIGTSFPLKHDEGRKIVEGALREVDAKFVGEAGGDLDLTVAELLEKSAET